MNPPFIITLLLCVSVLIGGCASTTEDGNSHTGYQPRTQDSFLTQQQAQYRSSRVSHVSYDLNFSLSNDERFSGTTAISFKLSGVEHPLTIDLDKATVKQLKVNGNVVKAQYNQSHLTIDPAQLHQGHNLISIDYQRLHSTNGEGLHRFKDPVDGKVYLYSHFEPAAAHQMFPSFDQPDLKATYRITVTAPQDWQVISTKRESQVTDAGPLKRWTFPTTTKLSSYNFSLHAGPYKMWQDLSGKYPARLFARQSVAHRVTPQMWFKFTHQGLTFFEQYFGVDYPFEKYDQIIVPDFLYGAMENAGAVTYAERVFLGNGNITDAEEEQLAMVIMHEMAHQWFGNLVTMKWWNGLWLNESFAAFMATLATQQATKFKHAWRSFYVSQKQSAYNADQSITTHPIEVPVASTANAFDNIDAITYSKGASVLKQLRHLLTPEIFRQGVEHYLSQFSYRNATLDDFIDSLSQTAGRDLSQWKEQWLYQPGVNTITAKYQCDNTKISEFTLNQDVPDEYPVYREQKVNIALFNRDAQGQLQLTKEQAVIYKGERTAVKPLIGSQCPDLVYPNYLDWAYVKVNLDQRSFNTAKSSIKQVQRPLLRAMLWQSLWDSVRAGLLPLPEYIDVVLNNIALEQDKTIITQVSRDLVLALRYLRRFGDSANAARARYEPLIEQLSWQLIQDNAIDHSIQQRWFKVYRLIASSEQALTRLTQLLNGQLQVAGLELSQSNRWDIIVTLNRHNAPDALKLIEQQLQQDKTDSGEKQAIAAQASRPDLQQKRYWLGQFNLAEPDYPFAKLRIAMANLFSPTQSQLMEQTADEIMAQLAIMDHQKGPVFMRSYARSMLPDMCNNNNLERLDQAVEQYTGLSTGTRRALLKTRQSVSRCIAMAAAMQ